MGTPIAAGGVHLGWAIAFILIVVVSALLFLRYGRARASHRSDYRDLLVAEYDKEQAITRASQAKHSDAEVDSLKEDLRQIRAKIDDSRQAAD